MPSRAPDVQARSTDAPHIGLSWLVRVRWFAGIAGLVGMVPAVSLLEETLPVAPMLALLALVLGTNLGLARMGSGPRAAWVLGAVLLFDTAVLTGLLALSGGPSNPFTVLYLVQVALAAVVLEPRWTWSVAAFSIAGFSLLFFLHLPLPAMDMGHGAHTHPGGLPAFDLHLYGMLLALAVAAVLVAWLVTRVTRALRDRDAALETARRRMERTERLASLTTLAAGAAHELGTPLGTIAVVAKELERTLAQTDGCGPLEEDARLVRSEVERCRTILDRMSVRAGEAVGEAPEPVDPEALVRDVCARLPHGHEGRLRIERDPSLAPITVPREAFTEVIASLVRNALDASRDGQLVTLAVEASHDRVCFTVRDDGRGMDAEELARAIEPFFTTKDTGRGMGLGLFLAQALAERLGGSLTLQSEPGRGTTARVEVPA